MTQIFYRLSNTTDPEERLEDAALAKALHDVLGTQLTILEEKIPFPDHAQIRLGRQHRLNSPFDYWNNGAFQRFAGRPCTVADLEETETLVAQIHAQGQHAFLKSVKAKHMVCVVRQGQSVSEALGDMIWSFIDTGRTLLVQPFIPMTCERRFLVFQGQIVTESPVAAHLTPLNRFRMNPDITHFPTPGSRDGFEDETLATRFREVALKIAQTSGHDRVCVDLALSGETIVCVAFNPLDVGQVGLCACDPCAIAQAVKEAAERRDPWLFENTGTDAFHGHVLSFPKDKNQTPLLDLDAENPFGEDFAFED